MIRKLVIVAAALAAFAFTAQNADAKSRKSIDPRINATAFWVGAGWTAGYFAINNWNWKWDRSAAGISQTGAAALTTIGCAATSPMVATVVLNRPLTYREAHILMGSCVIPFVGGWLVNEAYNTGWLWAPDEMADKKHHHRAKHHRGMKHHGMKHHGKMKKM